MTFPGLIPAADLHAHSSDLAAAVGPYTWGVIHNAVDTFPCGPCADTGKLIFDGVHDLFNVRLGKGLQRPKAFWALVSEVKLAVDQVKGQAMGKSLEGSRYTGNLSLGGSVSPLEVAALAKDAGIYGFSPVCSPQGATKWESCVQQVKSKGGANPFAVCTASVGCSPRRS